MNLKNMFISDKPVLSFEVFPPKEDVFGEKLQNLIAVLKDLQKYNPAFVSLTYGAGGTKEESFSTHYNIISNFKANLNLNLMPHFTCVGTSKKDVLEYLKTIKSLEVENVLALRGDIPKDETIRRFDFKHAVDLVRLLRSETDFFITVAGYPEGHIECSDYSLDMKYLKDKIEFGASAIITQMFFDNSKYFAFKEEVDSWGFGVPISAGIMPIKSYSQINKMLSMARVTLPKKLLSDLEKYKDSDADIKKVGFEFAVKQCQDLVSKGASGIHMYTLNTLNPVKQILDELDI